MGRYNFDEIIDRRCSGDLKHEALEERYGRGDLLPLWVADMDFATPSFIVDALKKRLEHPIFGYTVEPADYWPAVIDWNRSRHGLELKKEWLKFIPGIVKGIGLVIDRFSAPCDKVIIQPPVYHPFRLVPEGSGREVVYNPLTLLPDGRYEMDLEGLEALIDEKCKILILSNPHNPAGIAWDKETLRRLAAICHQHGILVISDEIHSDMALFGNRHEPFAAVSPEASRCSITFAAPSKTFNIAGIVSSYAIVPDPEIREKFYPWLNANELDEPTLFAPIATIAAYRHGEEWMREMLKYVEQNILFVEEYCSLYLADIKPIRPEASFLVWLDCRSLGLPQTELVDLFVNKARLALNDGSMFGPGGEGFMRLNVATPRSVLADALDRLKSAITNVKK